MIKLYEGGINSVEVSISIISHTGKVLDITEMVGELRINEDITSFTTAGSIIFIDSIGMVELLPIIGGEELEIIFRTSEDFNYFIGKYIIVKIPEQGMVTEMRNQSQITLYFVSKEYVENIKRTISKSFQNISISEIVRKLFVLLKSKKELEIEDTTGSENWITNNKTIFENIKLLKNNATSKKNNCGYLFFEDKDKFNFVSLEYMFNLKSGKKILLHNFAESNEKRYTGYIGLASYYNNIKSIDILEGTTKGIFGSKIATFDYNTKQVTENIFNPQLNLKENAIGKYGIVEKNINNYYTSIEEVTKYTGDTPDAINNLSTSTIRSMKNKVLYGILNSNCLVIGKAGDSDLTVGKVIEVEYRSIDDDEMLNEKLSGNYLIRSICHRMDGDGYQQVILVTKPFFSYDSKDIVYKI